ncbi:carbohydrate kinase family protein [Methanosphaera cuniculi]|uniref:carbohydrate kinase family protein n=1 Tax=Methanosphaera cuniculi TaxID=1077256 RepID=UPI0026EAB4A5|nr:carbohydrate kinase family protein [Methanosphaera cuniculi]
MSEIDLLVIGHTCFDYIMQVKEFSKVNTSALVTNLEQLHGGAAGNVAVIASKMGLDIDLISCVGKNFIGSKYESQLIDDGVNIANMIVDDNLNTPTAFVLTNPEDQQMFYFYWGAAEKYSTTPINEAAILDAEAMHIATGDPEYNIKCAKFAYSNDKLVSFDPGQDLTLYTTENLHDMLQNCNILFGNEHEIDYICDLLEMNIDEILEYGPGIIVKSLGSNGSEIYQEREDPIHIDALTVKAEDPTGAGDSYRAAFLSQYLRGNDVKMCGEFASTVASYIVQAQGTQTNIPTQDQVLEKMNDFYND